MAINLKKLNKAILNDMDLLLDLLIRLNFKNPRFNGNKIMCGFDDKSKGNAIIISNYQDELLTFTRFSTNESGSVIKLIQNKTGKDFFETINLLYDVFESNYILSDEMFDDYSCGSSCDFEIEEDDEIEYEVLDESKIGKCIISQTLALDKILPSTQIKYKVWKDWYSDRICFNWRDISGNLIGVMGRIDKEGASEEESNFKYFPIHPFKKKYQLFGLYENLKYIMKYKKVVLVESEKSVLQCHSFRFNLVCSIGSANISKHQLGILNSIGVKEIVLAFDNALDDLIEMLKKINDLIDRCGYNFNVKVLIDKEEKYMQNKESPSDNGGNVFFKLMSEKLVNINELITEED